MILFRFLLIFLMGIEITFRLIAGLSIAVIFAGRQAKGLGKAKSSFGALYGV